MNNFSHSAWAKLTAAFLVLGTTLTATAADVNIITIGDSLTQGSLDPNAQQNGLATYRPYLVGTVNNYLNTPAVNPSGITADFSGDRGDLALTPTGSDTPIALTGWDVEKADHEGQGQSSAGSWLANNWINSRVADDLQATNNVAVIMLGTNDLALLDWDPNAGPNQNGQHLFNTSNPMQVVNDRVNGLYEGFIPQLVDQLQALDPNVHTFIAPIPYVDQTLDFEYGATGSGGWWYNETDRELTGDNPQGDPINGWDFVSANDIVTEDPNNPGQFYDSRYVPAGVNGGNADGVDGDTDGNTTTNDIIRGINQALEEYVKQAPGNVTFVDALEQGVSWNLVDVGNVTRLVDGGNDFSEDDSGSLSNPDLADGLHLSFTGDQKYAAAFWEAAGVTSNPNAHANLRSFISATAAAAVPEPSSFLFLGLVSVMGIGANRFRRRQFAE